MRGLLFCLNLLLAVLQPTFTFAEYAIQPSYASQQLTASATFNKTNPQEQYFIQHEYFEVTDDDDSNDSERKSLSSHPAQAFLGIIPQTSTTDLSVENNITRYCYNQPIALFKLWKVFRI